MTAGKPSAGSMRNAGQRRRVLDVLSAVRKGHVNRSRIEELYGRVWEILIRQESDAKGGKSGSVIVGDYEKDSYIKMQWKKKHEQQFLEAFYAKDH